MESSGIKKAALTVQDETTLWRRFIEEQDKTARLALVEHYLDTARIIAAKLYAHRPSSELEFSDYMQYATVGLLEAIDKYDPARNASFKTYASYRIHGAILNGIEKISEKLEQGAFVRRLRRERAASLKQEVKGDAKGDLFYEMVDVAIGLALGYMLEDSGMFLDETKKMADDPYHCCELKLLQERILPIVDALPDRERLVIQYHYYQYVDFKDIGEVLGVSTGRVSQIHARALALLRQAYESLNKFDVSY